MKNVNALTLKLFNGVLKTDESAPFINIEMGYFAEGGIANSVFYINSFINEKYLSAKMLNKTFYSTWKDIVKATDEKLFTDQIVHYFTTYGTNFTTETYIPNEIFNKQNIPEKKVKFDIIKAFTKDELQNKCLMMLGGSALTKETIDDVLSVLNHLNYSFTDLSLIKNKEAMCIISAKKGIYPDNATEALRVIIFSAIGETLIIKDNKTIEAIKLSYFNASKMMQGVGLEKLATVFNRFKPLFLAFKTNKLNKPIINKIAKLSKTHHEPLVQNPLNFASSRLLKDSDMHWLDNATPYALFKALQATHDRSMYNVYRIRNGKSYAKINTPSNAYKTNFNTILSYIQSRFDLNGKKIFIPDFVKYALPTSEKMYIGYIPMGTTLIGERGLTVGVYWENDWGAYDIDLSALNADGKIGWDAAYRHALNGCAFSGDITYAPNGAVEYFWADPQVSGDFKYLVSANVYNGSPNAKFKIVVGESNKMSREYMMNPNNVIAEAMTQSTGHNNVIGLFTRKGKKAEFTFFQFSQGNRITTSNDEKTVCTRMALEHTMNNFIYFNDIVEMLGAEVINKFEPGCIDLSINNLSKSSFIEIFK